MYSIFTLAPFAALVAATTVDFVPLLVPILVAAIAALGAYIAAARKLSGKIGTSDASELWKESANIREDYRDRISVSERRTVDLEKRVASLEHENNGLVRENSALVNRIATLEAMIETLKTENEALRQVVDSLQESLKMEKEK